MICIKKNFFNVVFTLNSLIFFENRDKYLCEGRNDSLSSTFVEADYNCSLKIQIKVKFKVMLVSKMKNLLKKAVKSYLKNSMMTGVWTPTGTVPHQYLEYLYSKSNNRKAA